MECLVIILDGFTFGGFNEVQLPFQKKKKKNEFKTEMSKRNVNLH